MTAAEARKIATDKNTNGNSSQYSMIIDMINDAAKDGKYETWIYNTNVLPVVRELLETHGYKIGPTENDRHETLTKIEW